MLSAIALRHITTIEPDRTMKLSTSVQVQTRPLKVPYTLGYDFMNAVKNLKSSRYNVMPPRDPISCVCYVRNVVRFKEKDEIINECG